MIGSLMRLLTEYFSVCLTFANQVYYFPATLHINFDSIFKNMYLHINPSSILIIRSYHNNNNNNSDRYYT